MTNFTQCLATIVRLRVWRWPRRLSNQPFSYVRIRAKHISHMPDTYIADTSIMTVLWLNYLTGSAGGSDALPTT